MKATTSEWFVVVYVDGVPHYDTGRGWTHDQGKAKIWRNRQSAFWRADVLHAQAVPAGENGSDREAP